MKRAIIFDFDGTLADTLADLANSMNTVLGTLGLPVHPEPAYGKFAGDGIVMLCRRALGERGDDAKLVERLMADFREEYREHQFDTTTLFPHVPEMLDALAARAIRVAILSNKPHANMLASVDRLCSKWHFDAVRGQMDGVPRKPDPAGANAIIEEMGLPREAFLYVGDSGTDMATARAAGLSTVGVLWGFRDREELVATGADVLIALPMELLDLF